MIPWYDNAIGTYLAGVGLSFADRHFSKNAKKYEESRINEKLEQVASLQFIVEAEQNADKDKLKSGKEYAQAIENARDYFINNRQFSESKSKFGNFLESFRHYAVNERINKQSPRQNLGTALGIEFTTDALVWGSQALLGVGNALAAVGYDLFQVPLLFAGMQTGRGILYLKTSKKEKEYNRMAKDLTADGKILTLVRNYSPTANLTVESANANPQAQTPKAQVDYREITQRTVAQAEDLVKKTAAQITENAGAIYNTIRSKIMAKAEAEERAKKTAEEETKSRRDRIKEGLGKY
jgi:hypothetical protein